MDRMAELTRRERNLLDQVLTKIRVSNGRDADGCEQIRRLNAADRAWLARELSEMQMILERHLAELDDEEREIVLMQINLTLPLFYYLRHAFELLYPVVTSAP